MRLATNGSRNEWPGRRRLAATAETWTQRVGGHAALPLLFRELGADPVEMLSAAGLAAHALDRPDARIPYTRFGRLLAVAAERTRCDHVGLLAGRMLKLADLGRFGARVRAAGTVGDALRTFVAEQDGDSEGALAFVVEGATVTEFGYAIYHPYVGATDQIYDSALAAMTNYLRELCGHGWMPSEVLVPHARRSDERPYRALLRTSPRFDAEIASIRFPSRWMSRPVVRDGAIMPARADDAIAASHTDDAITPSHAIGATTLARAGGFPGPDAEPELVQQVFRALRRQLLDGRTAGDDVAKALGMNRRTLNRRLKARGLTYQRILDEMRFGLARQLLSTSNIGLYDLAANLGYAGTSPFARTFSRWAGTAPGRWRRFQLAQPAGASLAD